MNLRDALISQAPSLALQRAAQTEIARLDTEITRLAADLVRMGATLARRDAEIARLTEDLQNACAPHGEPTNETVKEADRG